VHTYGDVIARVLDRRDFSNSTCLESSYCRGAFLSLRDLCIEWRPLLLFVLAAMGGAPYAVYGSATPEKPAAQGTQGSGFIKKPAKEVTGKVGLSHNIRS
jgi:hypothetical protein